MISPLSASDTKANHWRIILEALNLGLSNPDTGQQRRAVAPVMALTFALVESRPNSLGKSILPANTLYIMRLIPI